jgi:predicted GNAT family N-acyltransferase
VSDLIIEISDGEVPAACVELRTQVFVREQGVAEGDEIDGRDGDCVHFLARAPSGPVGCGRLRPLGGEQAKVERVAVLDTLRSGGLGRRIMTAMEEEALRRGWPALILHAQIQVVGFYRRLGWDEVDDEFDEAGIVHLEMKKQLGA